MSELNKIMNAISMEALDAIPTPIFFKDKDGFFSGWNRAFAEFCGLTSYSAELGGSLGIYAEEDRKLLHEGGNVIVETFVTRADGKQRNVLLHKAGFVKNNGQTYSGLVGTMIDVTELRSAEKKADYLAHYDRLTELPNLVLFQDRLNTEIIHARRHDEHLAVFAIDIDHFKKVNNVFGHDLGDSLLKVVARRITETIREEDTAARFGGDSFTLLLRNIRYEEDAAIIAKKIHESISQPFLLDDQEVFISVSIGIALYPLDGDDVQTLIKNSDVALHRAKERGRRTHLFFTPEMNFRAAEQMKLQNSLRRALDRDEFIIHYQPQYDAESGRMIGVEALLRWQHPELGMVYPGQFIPLAEHIGLIVPIGEWVLRTACQDARAWNEGNKNSIRVAVNLSPRQFQQPDLYEKICQIIDETGVDPAWLGLEITESAVMQNVDYAICVLTDLKKLGIHLSVDDFGTGYSSLSYLKRFPIDLLKIDRSFITDIPKDSDDIAIVSAVVSMAHNLNLKVLAEGVETLEQKDFLHSICCDEFQGFYFSRPVAAKQIFQ
ncbi:MAG: bifunctional diguanylate cyclase/phosphodiesterase [Deltaproteobacteria bacterium]|nr:MAG: bifunctional diguanylate cyclase/phosphodiesterase [Deltaproteobacteria bacterium]